MLLNLATLFLLLNLTISTYIALKRPILPDVLRITICDVGQGDAVLISYHFWQVLIDAGPDEKVIACLKQKLPRGDTKIEVLIASHADHDHIGGVPAVLTRYSVESLIMTSQTKESDDFGLFVESVQKARSKGTKIIGSRQGLGIQLAPDMIIRLLSPEMDQAIHSVLKTGSPETHLSAYFDEPTSSDIATNDGSIAILVEYGNFTFLSTADLEERGEQTLIQGGLIKDIDVLKVGHHGSKTSTTDPFIDIIRPEFSLISCGQDNRYGHPHAEVLRRLGEINSAVLRTDQLGSIELQTNGQEYWFFLTQ